MNQLLTLRNGRTYYGRNRIDMYVFSVWLSDYNREHGLNLRPSTATAETFKAYLAALEAGYWSNYGKVGAK